MIEAVLGCDGRRADPIVSERVGIGPPPLRRSRRRNADEVDPEPDPIPHCIVGMQEFHELVAPPCTSRRARAGRDGTRCDASIRCMTVRRTTLAADREDLVLLEREAARRGISLAQVLRELVAREANELRRSRRPRFGVARTESGAAQISLADEHAPVRDRAGT